MSWRDAMHITEALLGDPSSHLAASLMGWQHPASREAIALLTLVDNDVASKTEKRAQFRRLSAPWLPKPKRLGSTTLPTADVIDLLKRARDGRIDGETVTTII